MRKGKQVRCNRKQWSRSYRWLGIASLGEMGEEVVPGTADISIFVVIIYV